MEKKYDVSGIGSALLDITFEIEDSVLEDIGLTKGNMTLIDSFETWNNQSESIIFE